MIKVRWSHHGPSVQVSSPQEGVLVHLSDAKSLAWVLLQAPLNELF